MQVSGKICLGDKRAAMSRVRQSSGLAFLKSGELKLKLIELDEGQRKEGGRWRGWQTPSEEGAEQCREIKKRGHEQDRVATDEAYVASPFFPLFLGAVLCCRLTWKPSTLYHTRGQSEEEQGLGYC